MQRHFNNNSSAIQQLIDYSTTIQRLFNDNSTTIQWQRAAVVMRRPFLCGMVSATGLNLKLIVS